MMPSTGRPVLKPIKFQETKVTRKGIAASIASVVVALGAAIAMRFSFETVPPLVVAIGALLLAPPLVWAGYTFVRDPELEGYTGRELTTRVLICAVGFSFLWVLYWKLPAYVLDEKDATEVSAVAAGVAWLMLLGLGGLISVLALELEYTPGLLHFGIYFVATLVLAVLAGVQLAAPLG